MRLIYMGTPDFAVDTLRVLSESEHEVVAVFCQPDRPKGRSGNPAFPPVKELAVSLGIPVYQPQKIREPEYQEIIKGLNADAAIVVAFGQILPKAILEATKYGCINVHASLLPKYRGSAPIQWSILDGEKETGVTIMKLDEGVDTGDILMQKIIEIAPQETADSLFEKLSVLGGPMILDTLAKLEKGEITPVPQGESPTAYAKMLTKEMGNIDWTEPCDVIERKVRGLNSWPCAYSYLGDKQIKIWMSKCTDEKTDNVPGAVVIKGTKMFVQTGDFLLELTEIQLAGKKRMPVDAFLRGFHMEPEAVLTGNN